MTNVTNARWLPVALAIVGLVLAPGLGSAHGNDTTAEDAPPYDATDDWATWMDGHMTVHMGPGAIEWRSSGNATPVARSRTRSSNDGGHN